ncbi:MAG: peptidase C39 family protein [Candidatus Poseidoniia archaeon]|nr:peptidase C39 family protein [Candidatus Poseidoniia archaeon]MDP7007389.1 peptidase C39 family protein [Candidatus Poseidoniia archaeon]
MQIDAPFYTQTMDFSCGAACALMALGHFNLAGPLDRDLEVEVWRETNAVEIGGCGRYGLAAPLALRGLRPHIISTADGLGLMERVHERVAGIDPGTLEFFHIMQQRLCARNGVTEERRKPGAADIRAALTAERLVLALVSTALFPEEDDEIPHWALVTGLRGSELLVHNPLDPPERAHRPVAGAALLASAVQFGEQALVTVGSRVWPDGKSVAEPPLPRGTIGSRAAVAAN